MGFLSVLAAATPRYFKLLRSQYWDPEDLRDYVHSAIGQTLRAASRIPFYGQRFDGSLSARDLDHLPILHRSEIGQLNQSVRSLFTEGNAFSSDSSSGSTGMPVEFLFDLSHQSGRFASRARYMRENGWSPVQRSAWIIYLGSYMGSEDEKLIRSRFLFGARFFSVPSDFGQLARQLRSFNPAFLYSYPAFLEALLNSLEETGSRLPALRRVFTGAEVLDDHVRSRTKTVMGVDIADNYGSTEAFIAWQCPMGKYHINAEHVFVEIVDEDGRPVEPGTMGRVLVTTLENRLMPLVRYEIGDYAVPSRDRCKCGRTLPIIDRVIGRGINLFRLKGGKQLISPWLLMAALRDRLEVRQFQIVQKEIDRFEVRFVSEKSLAQSGQDRLREDFARILGPDAYLTFERVDEIRRTASGKFMTTLSEVPPVSSGAAGS